MLRYGQLFFQYPPLDGDGDSIEFTLTKAVAGELIWLAAQARLRDDDSILFCWGAKCILQENLPSDLRAAIWEKANRLLKKSPKGTEGENLKALAGHVIFFITDYDEASVEESHNHFRDLIELLPGQNAATLIAAIGYKFGLTSL